MSKKGQQYITLAIIGFFVAAFLIIAYPKIAEAAASGKLAKKAAVARDIALILDTMYAYPYDMEVGYDVDLKDFGVRVEGSMVYVNLIEFSLDPTSASYSFVPANDNPRFKAEGTDKIIFKKVDGKIDCDYIIGNEIFTCLSP